jgi:hypothetical protein
MRKFSEQLTSDEKWPIFCVRDHTKKVVDGHGCTEDSYGNLTQFIDPFLDNINDEELHDKIKQIAPLVASNKDFKLYLGKDFSAENPDTNIAASIFFTTGEPIITKVEGG